MSAIAQAAAMIAKVKLLRDNLEQQTASALYIEANIELTEAKKRCPVAPSGTPGAGNLRASGQVTEPEIKNGSISCIISFGNGPSADYAVAVHEHLSPHSPPSWIGIEPEDINWNVPGTGPKFLESTILESRAYMAARVAKRIRLG